VSAPTPSQTVGPFFGFAMPFEGDSELAPGDTAGALRLEGQVLDGDGEPVPDALVEVWQGEAFGRCRTDPEGVYHFTLLRPEAGVMNVFVFARGLLRHLLTRMYFPDAAPDAALASVSEERRKTLFAQTEDGKLRFDIRLQGADETVFFELP
jgi:protocatechuate 3,4-dioxygenase alpha subunit